MLIQSHDYTELLLDLRKAGSRGELRLAAQPIAQCSTGNVVAVEALVRWAHSKRGLLMPAEFIPLAESANNRSIETITAWVLDEALSQLTNLDDQSCLLSFNVTARQIERLQFVADVQKALSYYEVNPSRLIVEITESGRIKDLDVARSVVTELQDLGVGVALDDFGEGQSSWQWLRVLPVNLVKIGMSLTASLHYDARSRAVMQYMISMVGELGAITCVEGVETMGHVDLLAEMGCDLIQGWLIGRPAPSLQEAFDSGSEL